MLALLVALTAATADAGSGGPYMWGVGPQVSTIAYPGRYPASFPKKTSGLEEVKGDMGVGARGVLYLDKFARFGGRVQKGFGPGFSSVALTGEYDQILGGSNAVYAFVGGGLGVGQLKFDSDEGGTLKVPDYVFRGHVGGYYREKTRAYEISMFAQICLPGVQDYTAPDTETTQVKGGFYSHLGVEATVYFGDFKPPSSKKKKKKKG